ncbi:NAD-dependent epimerase/dehydratase family protein [Nocardioides dilutus]
MPRSTDPLRKVLVTGGTGFVGSWITSALLEAGHGVRLAVRRPEQVAKTFSGRDVVPDDVMVVDLLDSASVARALDGCDAVVHAAALFSLDPRRAKEMLATNERATRTVLETAVEAGCDPVVHISSTVTLLRRAGTDNSLPLGDLDLPYSRSKIASERVARGLQERGASVVSVYPGGVYGPADPYLGEQATRLAWIARGLFPIWPAGGMHTVDVRDTAALVAACLQPGRGPRRYVVPGHHMTGDDLYRIVGAAIGRRRPHVSLPAWAVPAATAPIDVLHRLLPKGWRYPADREGAEVGARNTRFDTSPAEQELGVRARPLEESLRDTLTWLVDAGHLPATYRVGSLTPTRTNA